MLDKSYFTVKAENRQFEEAQAFTAECLRLHFCDTKPHPLKKVQIAGTNGKGSTAAMLASILCHAGYSTGLYTSPSLVTVNERIRLNGEMIPDDDLCSYIPVIAKAQDNIGRAFGGFERITAASMLYYLDNNVDIAVMETGLGGRYDTVSAVEELILSAVTSIGMDHMIMLGDTLPQIAWEKCGIMRDGVPTVAHMQKPEADEVIIRCARERSSRLVRTDEVSILSAQSGADSQHIVFDVRGEKIETDIPLIGDYQRENAASAILCAKELGSVGYNITNADISEGIKTARWDGRLQTVRIDGILSPVVIDGAHNPHAMRAVADYTERAYPGRRFAALISVMADKDIDGVLTELARFCDRVVCVSITPRSCPPEKLAHMAARHGLQADIAQSVREGLVKVDGMSSGERFYALGSLYLAGEVLKLALADGKKYI